MRVYMCVSRGLAGRRFYNIDMTKRAAISERAWLIKQGCRCGPLVTVDLPEPGTTKGKRGKT